MYRASPVKILLRKLSSETQYSVRNYNIPRRALMYVPGDDVKKITKAFTLDADCIALDCEDGVASNRKDAARKTIREVLDKGKPKRDTSYDLSVRVNSIDSGICNEDLKSCLTARTLPDTILLPKVDGVQSLNWFADEIKHLLPSTAKINLVIYIETAMAVLNLFDICKSAMQLSERFNFVPVALVFGSDDFCASIGATRTDDSTELLYARQKMVLTAKAFNLQAIDMVHIKYKDLDSLRAECEKGMKMGYTGKQVIHPGQIPIVQQAFLPTQSQIQWAEGLLKSYEEHQQSGKGAFTYQGIMVDMPTVKQARNVMHLSKLAK